VHPTHELFWRFITKNFDLKYIVSLNYDLLVEQALHESHQKNRSAPQCYYGGFQYDQIVRKMTNVTRKEAEQVALGHRYVLYKMHGSINWAWEHSPTIKIHDDVRAIFRRKRGWRPAVIAPIPEKNMPSEFSQIWNEAGKVLADADNWIVCGYSMPDFDLALRRFFERAVNFPAAYVVYIGSQQCSFGIQMADNA